MSKAQRRVLKLLESRAGEWVSRFELMGLGIVQYRERIRELRKAGYVIGAERLEEDYLWAVTGHK